jgi:hypothetical protein
MQKTKKKTKPLSHFPMTCGLVGLVLLTMIFNCLGASPSQANQKDPKLDKARSTFVKFRMLEEKGDFQNLLELYAPTTEVVLIDRNGQQLPLNREQYSKFLEILKKPINQEQSGQAATEVAGNILYGPLNIEPSQTKPNSYEVRGIRKNNETRRSAPIYLEIVDGNITHHAWEPIMEINQESLDQSQELRELLSGFVFENQDLAPLPSIDMEPSQSDSDQSPAETGLEETVNETKARLKAMRILSPDPLDQVALKLHKHLQKESEGQLDIVSAAYGDYKTPALAAPPSYPTDPKNYYITMIETLPNKQGNKQEPEINLVCVRLQKKPGLDEKKVIAIVDKLPLVPSKDGKIYGKEIKSTQEKSFTSLNKVIPEELSFE